MSKATKKKKGDNNNNNDNNNGKVSTQLDIRHIDDMEEIYDKIMADYPLSYGTLASKKDRTNEYLPQWHNNNNLIYSEIDFVTIGYIIEKINKVHGRPNTGSSGHSGKLQNRGGIFYDLGSGSGKVSVAAALLHPFDSCYGIECLGSLILVANEIAQSYNTVGKSSLNRDYETFITQIFGNFLDIKTRDWRDGDLIFANSSTYDDNTMKKLALLAHLMKRGTFFVTVSQKLPSNDFIIVEHFMRKTSWGEASIYIHQKTTHPGNDDIDDEDDHPEEDRILKSENDI
jgi:hypothetical protein